MILGFGYLVIGFFKTNSVHWLLEMRVNISVECSIARNAAGKCMYVIMC